MRIFSLYFDLQNSFHFLYRKHILPQNLHKCFSRQLSAIFCGSQRGFQIQQIFVQISCKIPKLLVFLNIESKQEAMEVDTHVYLWNLQTQDLHLIFTINQFPDHNIILHLMKISHLSSPAGKIIITFKVLKKTNFGKAVYVIGNIPQLGCWKINSSLKLNWTQGHYWSANQAISKVNLKSDIEFKYVVGNFDYPQNHNLEWEAGEANRKIQLSPMRNWIVCDNLWNMDNITLNLIVSVTQKQQNYGIIGNCRELGSWKKLVRLTQDPIDENQSLDLRSILGNENVKKYSATIQIFRAKPSIHYYYVKNDKQVTIERHPGRKFDVEKNFHSHRRCVKISHLNGGTQLFETCVFHQLNYSQVTQNIFLGAYVKTIQDFKQLKKEQVTAILSIQTDQDLASHCLTPNYLSQVCDQYEIKFIPYSIEDMNKKDFLTKWTGAVIILRNLLRFGHKVYVHCSAGVYRSPQIVALYFMMTNHVSPSEAIEFVKKKHPFARPNHKLINTAFQLLSKEQNI